MIRIYGTVRALTDIGKEHQNPIPEGSKGLLINYQPDEELFEVLFDKRGLMEFQMGEMLFNSIFHIDWARSESEDEIFAYYIDLNANRFTLSGGSINVNDETDTMEEAIDLIKTNQSMKFDFEVPTNLSDDQKEYLMELAKDDIGKFFRELDKLNREK